MKLSSIFDRVFRPTHSPKMIGVKVNHLLVVSGMSAVGKSFFLSRLRQNSLPIRLCNSDLSEAKYASANEMVRLTKKFRFYDELVLHYDIFRKISRATAYEADVVAGLVKRSKRITFVSLVCTPDVHSKRLQDRVKQRRGWARFTADYYEKNPPADLYHQYFFFLDELKKKRGQELETTIELLYFDTSDGINFLQSRRDALNVLQNKASG